MGHLDKTHGVHVTRDVLYATAGVNFSTTPTLRELRLDVYEPDGAPVNGTRPALVMAFGGAFHRGNKEADEFDNEGHRNTPVSVYCNEFARRGYVAYSIDYRLVQEDPDPGSTPVFLDKLNIPRSRIDYVRNLLGLPPATSEMIWAGMEAACDDMVKAFRFVQANASRYSVDPGRIAIGGFSAGARIALAAAYCERVPAAAVTVIFADPLNDVPLIVRAVWSVVAVDAFPVNAPENVVAEIMRPAKSPLRSRATTFDAVFAESASTANVAATDPS